jgi:chemotaxis protein CheZ
VGTRSKSRPAVKHNGGRTALAQAQDAVNGLVGAVRRSRKGVGQRVQSEIEHLSKVVEKTSGKIIKLRPEEIPGWRLDAARNELDAVIQHTEAAASDYLSAAEELDAIADTLPKKKAELLRSVTTKMYETSTFQDISGQRLVNAKNTLAEIDNCVTGVLKALGHETTADEPPANDVRDESDLLNGPQMQGSGVSQEDVDALLESFD